MRFDRQIILPEIGEAGQQKLCSSSVVVLGAGGLGCPALTYLCAAGVGTIKIIDFDTVSVSNLNRQFLHGVQDVGRLKAESAFEKLSSLYKDINFSIETKQVTAENVEALIGRCDLIIDCVDTIGTRLVVNDYSLAANIPLVEGGLSGFHGFVTAVKREGACLRCFGLASANEESSIPTLGTTAGVIGSLEANEAIKILLGLPGTLFGKMLYYDGLRYDFDLVEVKPDPACVQMYHGDRV